MLPRAFLAGTSMAAALLAGCTLRAGPTGGGSGGESDAAAAGGPADAARAPADAGAPDAFPELGPFGAPEPIEGINDPDIDDDDPSMTGDLRELYFNRGADIWVATREAPGDPWGALEPVAELNTADTETTPRVSYDGETLLFASDRAGGGGGGTDLWIATRADRDQPWSAPEPLTELNSAGADLGAAMGASGTLLVFHSNRDGNQELYASTRSSVGEPWEEPAPIAELNTAGSETSPFIARGGRAIYFGSDSQLYVAERSGIDEPFGLAVPVEGVDGPGTESDVWVSGDERRILFTSDRDGENQLYRASR